jgi:hypothetical protein
MITEQIANDLQLSNSTMLKERRPTDRPMLTICQKLPSGLLLFPPEGLRGSMEIPSHGEVINDL